jgi:hypothetical protein
MPLKDSLRRSALIWLTACLVAGGPALCAEPPPAKEPPPLKPERVFKPSADDPRLLEAPAWTLRLPEGFQVERPKDTEGFDGLMLAQRAEGKLALVCLWHNAAGRGWEPLDSLSLYRSMGPARPDFRVLGFHGLEQDGWLVWDFACEFEQADTRYYKRTRYCQSPAETYLLTVMDEAGGDTRIYAELFQSFRIKTPAQRPAFRKLKGEGFEMDLPEHEIQAPAKAAPGSALAWAAVPMPGGASVNVWVEKCERGPQLKVLQDSEKRMGDRFPGFRLLGAYELTIGGNSAVEYAYSTDGPARTPVESAEGKAREAEAKAPVVKRNVFIQHGGAWYLVGFMIGWKEVAASKYWAECAIRSFRPLPAAK